VLTVEFLEGTPIAALLAGVAPADIDRQLVAERLVEAVLTQVFMYQFFHADPHPGNLIVLPGEVIGFVDFGLCDEIDDTIRQSQFQYLEAAYSQDDARIFRAITEILVQGPETDMEAFRREFLELLRDGEASRESSDGRSLVSHFLIDMMRIARQNGLRVPARVLSMYRALLTVDTVAAQLGYQDGLRRVGGPFFSNLHRREIVSRVLSLDNVEEVAATVLSLVRESPGQLQQILSDAAEGSLSLKVETSESARAKHQKDERTKLTALAALSISLAILVIAPFPAPFSGPLHVAAGSALAYSYLRLFLIWRRL
jgi:ubiquinone biosynthesis protein